MLRKAIALGGTTALAILVSITLSLSAMAAAGSGGSGGGGGSGGSGGSGGAGPGSPGGGAAPAPIACSTGLLYSDTKGICVRELACAKGKVFSAHEDACVNQESMNDRELYDAGRALALAGYYQDALDTLGAIRNKNDAMVLTMIGYSTRKLGHTDEGIAIYHQALAIDPNNVNTHEYLGEGYLASGRVDLAELELDTLQKLCGTTCEQYQDLQKALAGPAWN